MDVYDLAAQIPGQLTGARTVTTSDLGRRRLDWMVRTGRATRAHRGTYLVGSDPTDLLDRVRAALAVCGPHAVIGHHTAALLLGFGVLDSAAIHVVVPAGTAFPQRPGIATHQCVVPLPEPATVRGVPCTPAARCAIDLARMVRRRDVLAVLDAALRTGACDAESLSAELARHDRLRGIKQARDLVPLADPRAPCRQESQLRLTLYEGGLRGFQPQFPVMDDGYARYYLDLADPVTRVGVEYDGSSHLDRQRMRRDRFRHNWLDGHGWRMRYFTDRDLYGDPASIVDTVRAARHRVTDPWT